MEMISAKFIEEMHKPMVGSAPTSRQDVAAHFRDCANGVAPEMAQQRTRSFYRSSGHAWSMALS